MPYNYSYTFIISSLHKNLFGTGGTEMFFTFNNNM